MIVNNSLDEVKKRENALSIIKNIIETKGRNELYDLTGLSGGFIASSSQLSLLETYVGPAIFEDEIQEVGKKHLGGEKILPLNRTSSGILATILSLVDEGSNVVHYLAQLPAHPSIPRSCELVKANYFETDVLKSSVSSAISVLFNFDGNFGFWRDIGGMLPPNGVQQHTQ